MKSKRWKEPGSLDGWTGATYLPQTTHVLWPLNQGSPSKQVGLLGSWVFLSQQHSRLCDQYIFNTKGSPRCGL